MTGILDYLASAVPESAVCRMSKMLRGENNWQKWFWGWAGIRQWASRGGILVLTKKKRKDNRNRTGVFRKTIVSGMATSSKNSRGDRVMHGSNDTCARSAQGARDWSPLLTGTAKSQFEEPLRAKKDGGVKPVVNERKIGAIKLTTASKDRSSAGRGLELRDRRTSVGYHGKEGDRRSFFGMSKKSKGGLKLRSGAAAPKKNIGRGELRND